MFKMVLVLFVVSESPGKRKEMVHVRFIIFTVSTALNLADFDIYNHMFRI